MYFEKIPVRSWSSVQRTQMSPRLTGHANDWKKKSLKWARDDVKATLLQIQRYQCAYCRGTIEDNPGKVEIDHVIAKELAPAFCYHVLNLVLVCKRCNINKGKRNVTALPDAKLQNRRAYIRRPELYSWVHPFFHVYSEHIEIRQGIIYAAKNGSPNGLSVITACKLDRMSEVSARSQKAVAASKQNFLHAMLAVAGQHPAADADELADILIGQQQTDLSRSQVVELIDLLRTTNPIEMLQRLKAA